MKPKKKLKNYKISVDKADEGVDFISLVKNPAIMVNWVAFEAQKPPIKFAQDGPKRMLSGPFLIPDLPIYRNSEELGEFTVTFDKQTIETIVKRFFASKNVTNINESHTDKMAPAYLVESWIISDPKTDKSSKLGFDLPVGTWFGTIYVEDQAYWDNMIDTEQVLGFSVEGLMGLAMSQINKSTMANKNTFPTEDGKVIINKQDSAALAVGDEIMWLAEDGTTSDVPDGDYKMKDGSTITVEAGFVTDMKAAEAPVEAATDAQPADAATTDVKPAVSEEEILAVVGPLMESFKAEVTTAITQLSDRIAALESGSADASASVDAAKAELSELKKKFSEIPGGKFITIPAEQVNRHKYSNKFEQELERVKELKKTLQ